MKSKVVALRHAEEPDRASEVRQQLDRGFRAMRFVPYLEAGYRVDQFRDGQVFLRINLLLLMALILTIVQVDQMVIPEFSQKVGPGPRLGAFVPLLTIALVVSFVRNAPRWYPRIMTPLMALALIGIGWTGLVAWSMGENRVFVRLVIAIVAVYFVMGFRFYRALSINIVAVAFYAWAATGLQMPPAVKTQFLMMLLTISVICVAGAYNLEYARRKAWLEGELRKEVALRDALTGTHNRRRFDEHLQRVWQQGLRDQKPVAILISDVDCFRAFNLHYGHQAGDDALKAVASVHSRSGRRPFDMAARFGGEEFAVVLYDAGRQEALRIAEEITKGVEALKIPHMHSTAAPVVTVSIGIASTVPTPERDTAGLMQGAGQALYAAKNDGRNRARLLDAH